MLHVILFQPEIPQNTGNIGRMCAFSGARLHLIHPLGFEITDKHLRRSGMDYWQALDVVEHHNWQTFLDNPERPQRIFLFSTRAKRSLWDVSFAEGDGLLFGNETSGCPAELHEWDDSQGKEWAAILEPLAQEAAARFRGWLPKLSHPVRTGEHSQTAFALGLVLDWARSRKEDFMATLVEERCRTYYLKDRGANLAFEPGGQDFLSPALAEADLMRRILDPTAFAAWLGAFLPELSQDGSTDWMKPAVVTDRTDGKLAHLDGLNLARAWMLEGIAAGLPPLDPRLGGLRAVARKHRESGLAAVTGEHYEGGHWLGSFAIYLVTRRGL